MSDDTATGDPWEFLHKAVMADPCNYAQLINLDDGNLEVRMSHYNPHFDESRHQCVRLTPTQQRDKEYMLRAFMGGARLLNKAIREQRNEASSAKAE